MTEVVDPASVIEAAHGAAASGDFSTAERLLREAAALQKATLGPDHPDLASTLNNLAFACEQTNNLGEAERNYRRAHAIAVASLGPRHPFVATSIKNLVDFCAAHDIPIWAPPAAASHDAHAADTDAASEPEPATHDRNQSVRRLRWPVPRTMAVGALGLAVIVVIAFAMRERETPPSARVSTTSSPTAPALRPDASPAAAVDARPEVAPTRVERPESRERVDVPPPREKNVTPQAVTLLAARLCSALEKRGAPDWQCTSATRDLPAGTYSFYTRVMTNANTTVEHRWYRDGRVHQVMRLRVSANSRAGYRTFSSTTISPERVGDWKVELRAADGTLLHEEHFVIR
jgi:hypothetical protein